jgi:hypothetical protein
MAANRASPVPGTRRSGPPSSGAAWSRHERPRDRSPPRLPLACGPPAHVHPSRPVPAPAARRQIEPAHRRRLADPPKNGRRLPPPREVRNCAQGGQANRERRRSGGFPNGGMLGDRRGVTGQSDSGIGLGGLSWRRGSGEDRAR